MYGCESWTINKAEGQRTDAFEQWCWRRLLRVPWNARRSNQFILKEISLNAHWKDWCWSRHSNTLATWCKELTHLKRPWCWERLKAGREGGNRGGDGYIASLIQWTWIWANSWKSWRTSDLGVLQSMGLQRVGHNWATELNWEFSPLFHSLFCVVGRETLLTQSSSNPASLCCVVRSSLWALSFSPFSSRIWKERQSV